MPGPVTDVTPPPEAGPRPSLSLPPERSSPDWPWGLELVERGLEGPRS